MVDLVGMIIIGIMNLALGHDGIDGIDRYSISRTLNCYSM